MLKALVFSLVVGLALGGPGKGQNHESNEDNSSEESSGWCPDVIAPRCVNGTNGTAENCTTQETLPTSAPDCTNVTAKNCSTDAACPAPQECCQTSCGKRCLDLIPYKACSSDADCAGEPKKFCKKGTCSSDCGEKGRPSKKFGQKKGGRH
ncbi:hypothetical protein NDU88_000314 [Pleurodeles waltl]|uniref:WAP domain-containing protein n=1 Tax=Pleurodeles waltl TaxID=8319 RepID=A0AAV7P3S5_PLEWA|nr:hypothetical protein NDU88_000314 [Pleurodeles waltl]